MWWERPVKIDLPHDSEACGGGDDLRKLVGKQVKEEPAGLVHSFMSPCQNRLRERAAKPANHFCLATPLTQVVSDKPTCRIRSSRS